MAKGDILHVRNSQRATAVKLASDLGAEFFSIVADATAIKKKAKNSVFVVMLKWLVSCEEKKIEPKSFPVPGSTEGNNPARYKVEVISEGEKKAEPHDFYRDMWLASGDGIAWLAKYHKATDKGNTANKQDIDRLVKDLKQERNYCVDFLRRAVGLYFQVEALSEFKVPGGFEISYEASTDKDGDIIVDTLYPFTIEKIKDPNKPGDKPDFRPLSIGEVENTDVAKIKAGGGTWEAFLKSREKARKSGSSAETTVPMIVPVDKLELNLAQLVNSLQGKTESAAFRKLLLAKENATLRQFLGDAMIALTPHWQAARPLYEQEQGSPTNLEKTGS